MRKQKTLLDFIGEEKQKPSIRQSNEAQTKEEKQLREEELVQKLMELFEQHNRCLKRDDVVAMLGVTRHKAVKLLHELAQIGFVVKRLNDNGELVYCKKG